MVCRDDVDASTNATNRGILASQVHPIPPQRGTRSQLKYLHVHSNLISRSSVSESPTHLTTPNGVHAYKPPTLDDKYTGHILVSGYNGSCVLPKEFRRRFKDDAPSNTGIDPGSFRHRSSISDKGTLHFTAAIEPLPPRAPYLVSSFSSCNRSTLTLNF